MSFEALQDEGGGMPPHRLADRPAVDKALTGNQHLAAVLCVVYVNLSPQARQVVTTR